MVKSRGLQILRYLFNPSYSLLARAHNSTVEYRSTKPVIWIQLPMCLFKKIETSLQTKITYFRAYGVVVAQIPSKD